MDDEEDTLQPRGPSSGWNRKEEGDEHRAVVAALFNGNDERGLGLGFKTKNDSNVALIVDKRPSAVLRIRESV